MTETDEPAINRNIRLREGNHLRLAQLLSYYRRNGPYYTADSLFSHIIDLLEAERGLAARPADASGWPGGRCLTPREQRLLEATLTVNYPGMMSSRRFAVAFRAIQRAPYGAERAQLLTDLLDDYRSGSFTPQVDALEDAGKAFLRQRARKEVEQDFAEAQLADRGRRWKARGEVLEVLGPGPKEGLLPSQAPGYADALALSDQIARPELTANPRPLLPNQIAALPPGDPQGRVATEPLGKVGDPSPDGSEERLQEAARAYEAERARQAAIPLEKDPQVLAWKKRAFGDGLDGGRS